MMTVRKARGLNIRTDTDVACQDCLRNPLFELSNRGTGPLEPDHTMPSRESRNGLG